MAWGIIIAFATLFGTMILVLVDTMNADESSFDETESEHNVRHAA